MKKTKKYSQTREELLLKLIHRDKPRANDGHFCEYDKDVNGGCAIGCDISLKLSKSLLGDVDTIFDELPKRLQNMGKNYLSDIQNIHDKASFWIDQRTGEKGKDGLVWNNSGKERINSIIRRYNLQIPLLPYIYDKNTLENR